MKIEKAIQLFMTPDALSYCDDPMIKTNAHRAIMRALRTFAREHLGLDTSQYDLRSNKAGIAVSGEVTLHTDPFGSGNKGIYIQVGDSIKSVLVRTCDNKKDYTGHQNDWADANFLLNADSMARFAEKVKRMVG